MPAKRVFRKIAASSTTAAVSVPGDQVKGRDYLERVVITAASTAAPGAVTVFDGATSLLVHNAQLSGYTGTNVYTYNLGITSDTTVGFNVSCGTSVSCLCVGIF